MSFRVVVDVATNEIVGLLEHEEVLTGAVGWVAMELHESWRERLLSAHQVHVVTPQGELRARPEPVVVPVVVAVPVKEKKVPLWHRVLGRGVIWNKEP